MMEFIKKSKFDCSSVELGVQALRDHLCGKRYLLVLDDVWNTNQDTWDSLRNALRRISGSECSKILVTTRDRGVAETMHTSEIHHLPELSRVDSWSLFKRTAFSSRISYHDSVLEEIGKRIVNKCRGVPLAIKTIVGVLNAKKGVREWEIVEKSGVQLDKAGILSSLELSYTYLPTPLKKCFSFLSTYRKGSTDWSKHSLIRLWVANGFLHQPLDVNLTMEDIGEEYFSMLIRISFLQECGRNDLGQITRFTIHDLVHDLATYVGKHECLCLDLKAGDIRGHNLEKVKHLSLNGESSAFPDALVLENLRSFISECNLPKGIVLHLKYLRSLQLRDINLEELPVSIAGCKCLKFLDLSGNPIKMLPDWIMSLYSLQTLYLLRCPNLIRIPKGLGKLVNLRHFEVDKFLDLPTGVGHLSSVQTLPRLKVRDRGFQISELRYLQHVSGSLHIGGLELVKSKQDAEMANLSEKSRVERLYLYWTISRREDHSKDLDEEILEGLYPNSNLQVLYIKNYGSKKFPAWVMKKNVSKDIYSESQQLLRNLTKIELVECRRCDELPTMGHLPCLKILKISEMESLKRIGRELYSCGGTIINGASHYPSGSTKPPLVCFPKLEELRLNHLDNLEEWSELEGPMVCFPRLELLVIELCAKLRTSPNKFPSLKNFTANGVNSGLLVSRIIRNNTTQCSSLRTLKIWNCPKLTSLPDLSGLTSLRELSIACNESLRCPPSGLKSCTSLEILEFFKCRKSEAITEDLSGLGRLSQLSISGQTELITQPPDWLLNGLPRLELLDIGSYVELEHYPDISPLLKITSLVRLYLWGWRKLQSQTLPDQLQRFTRLTTLVIDGFDELEQLPEWLGNLSSLEYLSLYRCPKLKRLASMDAMKRLTKLSNLRIWKCRLLEDSVKVGAEHYKVAHIHVRVFKPWETPS